MANSNHNEAGKLTPGDAPGGRPAIPSPKSEAPEDVLARGIKPINIAEALKKREEEIFAKKRDELGKKIGAALGFDWEKVDEHTLHTLTVYMERGIDQLIDIQQEGRIAHLGSNDPKYNNGVDFRVTVPLYISFAPPKKKEQDSVIFSQPEDDSGNGISKTQRRYASCVEEWYKGNWHDMSVENKTELLNVFFDMVHNNGISSEKNADKFAAARVIMRWARDIGVFDSDFVSFSDSCAFMEDFLARAGIYVSREELAKVFEGAHPNTIRIELLEISDLGTEKS